MIEIFNMISEVLFIAVAEEKRAAHVTLLSIMKIAVIE